jgi:hypothetical protein
MQQIVLRMKYAETVVTVRDPIEVLISHGEVSRLYSYSTVRYAHVDSQ